jgi:hypothetical protein
MKSCSCCGASDDIQMHHLYPKSKGCPDTLIVPLCYRCHRNAHGLKANINHSELTHQGLLAAKARGTKLGWAIPARAAEAKAAAEKGTVVAAKVRIEQADSFAAKILPIVRPLAEAGQSLRQIAAALNNQGIGTPRGKEWQAASVKNLLSRNYHV